MQIHNEVSQDAKQMNLMKLWLDQEDKQFQDTYIIDPQRMVELIITRDVEDKSEKCYISRNIRIVDNDQLQCELCQSRQDTPTMRVYCLILQEDDSIQCIHLFCYAYTPEIVETVQSYKCEKIPGIILKYQQYMCRICRQFGASLICAGDYYGRECRLKEGNNMFHIYCLASKKKTGQIDQRERIVRCSWCKPKKDFLAIRAFDLLSVVLRDHDIEPSYNILKVAEQICDLIGVMDNKIEANQDQSTNKKKNKDQSIQIIQMLQRLRIQSDDPESEESLDEDESPFNKFIRQRIQDEVQFNSQDDIKKQDK